MNKLKIISSLLGLISIPISLYINFWVISQLHADRLIWFLYIINIPLIIFIVLIQNIIKDD